MEVRSGMLQKQAFRKYNIPKSSLIDRLSGTLLES